MAATETITKIAVSLKLNNGTSETGAIKTKSQSFPTLSATPSDFDADKVMNLVTALTPLLDKALIKVVKTVASDITTSS